MATGAADSDSSESDPLTRQTLGDHIFHHYVEAKTAAWESYNAAVHPWEIERYLSRY